MSKGSAPTLHLDWGGEDLVMTVRGTPVSAKATRARKKVAKGLLTLRDRENLTEEVAALLAQAFPFLTVRMETE